MERRDLLLAGGSVLAAAACSMFAGSERLLATRAPSPEEPTGLDRSHSPNIGINLTPISYWNPVVFRDRLKASSGWATYGRPAPVDQNGYPTSLDGQRLIATMIPCEPGRYIFSHNGDLDARVQSATLVERTRNRSVFVVSGTIGSQRQLIIDSIRQPATHMSFVREEEVNGFAAGDVFSPDFMRQILGMNTLRFMDWMRTNASPLTNSLPDPNLCSYANGVPVEIIAELAQRTGAHPWLCVPHQASDEVIISILEIARASGSRVPYLEYSNEVWNPGFLQSRYAHEQATARWGSGAPAGLYYGYRSAQIAKIARRFRARVVLGGQTVVPDRAGPIFEGVRLGGATDHDFYGWIVATYVSGTLTNPDGPTLALANRMDVTGAINDMLHSTGPGALSVATMAEIYKKNGQIASHHGLKLIAYEGNLHLTPLPNFDSDKVLVKAFFKRVIESAAVAQITEANLMAFAAAGGSLACLYNLSSPPSDGGYFGLASSGSWKVIQQRLGQSDRSGE